jgi:hypothetical protein
MSVLSILTLTGAFNGFLEVENGGPVPTRIPLSRGTVVLNGATPVTVAAPSLTADSVIVFGLKTVGGTVGATPAPKTVTPGTGFTVAGTAGDTSTYNWMVIG